MSKTVTYTSLSELLRWKMAENKHSTRDASAAMGLSNARAWGLSVSPIRKIELRTLQRLIKYLDLSPAEVLEALDAEVAMEGEKHD